MENNELKHYGILGMKWGVRRSEAQLARIRGKSQKGNWSDDAKTAAEIKTKSVKQMSNAELKKLNERQQLEKQHEQLNPSTFKKGVAYVASATAVMATAVNLYNTSNNTVNIGKTVSNKILDKVGKIPIRELVETVNDIIPKKYINL